MDITEYADKHPGGDVIYDGAGRDCTRLFNKHHRWVNPETALPELIIGYVPKKAPKKLAQIKELKTEKEENNKVEPKIEENKKDENKKEENEKEENKKEENKKEESEKEEETKKEKMKEDHQKEENKSS